MYQIVYEDKSHTQKAFRCSTDSIKEAIRQFDEYTQDKEKVVIMKIEEG